MKTETRLFTLAVLVILVFGLALTALILTSTREAAAGECPPAEEILDGFVAATGGVDAYKAVSSKITKAVFEIPAQGISGELTIYHARPKKFRSTVEIPAIGMIDRGISGDVAWESSMMTGPQIKDGPEKVEMLRDADFDGLWNWREMVEKAECTGVDTVAGTPCWRVVVTYKEGNPRTMYVDTETNLVIATESKVQSQMGEIPLMAYDSDYQVFNGIKQAMTTKIVVMGQERWIKVKSIEYDAEMPEGVFDLPDDVKALVTEE